jgi:hypothetical protein
MAVQAMRQSFDFIETLHVRRLVAVVHHAVGGGG